MIINLDLESPDTDYLLTLLAMLKQTDSVAKKESVDKFKRQQYSDPLLNQVYFEPYYCEELKNYVKEKYQPLFRHTLHPTLICLRNHVPDHPKLACYMPHTDRDRAIGLNFCIKPGGKNVTTTFYNEHANLNVKDRPYKLYQDLTVSTVVNLNDPTWVAINTHHYHSVENIETERILLSLGIRDIALSRFATAYPSSLVTPQ